MDEANRRTNIAGAPPVAFQQQMCIRDRCWTRTGKPKVLNISRAELKTLPLGTSLYADARPLCTVELAKDGLWIEPSAGTQVSLQRASDDKVVAVVRRQRLKSDSRSGVSFWLHLGSVEAVSYTHLDVYKRQSTSSHYAAAARLRHGTDGWTGPND